MLLILYILKSTQSASISKADEKVFVFMDCFNILCMRIHWQNEGRKITQKYLIDFMMRCIKYSAIVIFPVISNLLSILQ